MNCCFCHSGMDKQNDVYGCRNCGATYDGITWTDPIKNLNCVSCGDQISILELAPDAEGILICKKCHEKNIRTPKFYLGQEVWYMQENKVCQGTVWTKCVIANSHDSWACTKQQKESWQFFGESGISYVTCHGVFKEEEVFASKEELLKSL